MHHTAQLRAKLARLYSNKLLTAPADDLTCIQATAAAVAAGTAIASGATRTPIL